MVNTKDKGRGVQAAKDFSQGDFVVEYAGELLEIEEAEEREKNYGKDIGSYMYFFELLSKYLRPELIRRFSFLTNSLASSLVI